MTEPVDVAVPRKGRPLEAVLGRLADRAGDASAAPTGHHRDGDTGSAEAPTVAEVADDVISTLRYEKAVTKDAAEEDPDATVYDRLAAYSDLDAAYLPEYSLLRDD